MKKHILFGAVLLLAATVSIPARAQQDIETIVVDGAPMATFLETVTDARSAAMGGIGSVVSPGTSGIFHNHAASLFSGHDFGAGVSAAARTDFSEGGVYSLGAFYNLKGKHGLGLGVRYTPMPMSSSDMSIDMGYGIKLLKNLSVSISARYVNSEVGDESAGAFGADIGAYYQGVVAGKGKWNVGLQAYNIGITKFDFGGAQDYSMPTHIRLGGSIAMPFSSHSVAATINGGYRLIPNDATGFEAGFGAEYGYKNMVFARAGYHIGDENVSLGNFATIGIGGGYGGIRFDVAYWLGVDDPKTKNILFLSLSAMF